MDKDSPATLALLDKMLKKFHHRMTSSQFESEQQGRKIRFEVEFEHPMIGTIWVTHNTTEAMLEDIDDVLSDPAVSFTRELRDIAFEADGISIDYYFKAGFVDWSTGTRVRIPALAFEQSVWTTSAKNEIEDLRETVRQWANT